MFGFFKKKAPEGSFIIVAVQAAAMLRHTENQNGGLYSSPEAIKLTVHSVAKQMNVELAGNLGEATQSCVMALLMDQKFIDGLLIRAKNGPIGTLTTRDEDEIDRIVAPVFKG
jgi:hypothetical protein